MNYKTCSTTHSRQNLDAGHGIIHVPASYGSGRYDNDDCDDVTVGDCPQGYKSLPPSSANFKDDIDEDHAVPDPDLKTLDCWRGGNTSGKGGQATHGLSAGITKGVYELRSDAGGARNNFSKPCFKDATGWKKTNPINGHKLTSEDEQGNMDACCGFKKSVRDVIHQDQGRFCNPDYCFSKGSTTPSGGGDDISRNCATRLKTKCENWSSSSADDIGFEDKRCADPLAQMAAPRPRDTLTVSQETNANTIPASITADEYQSIGERLCTVGVFMNNEASTGTKDKEKYEKCLGWCKNNPSKCSGVIGNVCEAVYTRAKANPDTYPNDITKYEGLCSCNWPQEFYDNVVKHYKEKYKKTNAELDTQRKCLFGPCNGSAIQHYDATGRSDAACPDRTFITCIQELTLDFTGAEISDTIIETGQSQSCGRTDDNDSSTSEGSGQGDGGGPEGRGADEEEDKDNTLLFVIAVIISLFFLFSAVGVMVI